MRPSRSAGQGTVAALVRASCAGYAATLMMEQISSAIYARHSQAVREREEQLRKEMPTTTLARKAAAALGRQLDDAQADRAGMWLHYLFGAGGGPVTELLVRRGMAPVQAGLTVGMAMFVFVDEGFNTVARLTPPPAAWPLATHVRALVSHVAYGTAVGLLVGGSRW